MQNNKINLYEKYATGKELWIHSEEDGEITLNMDEAQKLRNYLNSLDLK